MKSRAESVHTSGCEKGARKGAGQRIFDTACELFYKRGIRAVGVDEIVSAAGVTKPSLYRNYASKDELVTACLEKYAEDSRDGIDRTLAAAGDDPRAKLRAFVGHYAALMTRQGFRGCPMSNTAVEFPESGQTGRPVVEHCKAEFRERIVELTRQMPVREPEALADGLVLLIEGAFSTHQIFGTQGPSQALIRSSDALIEAYSIRN